MEEIIVGMKELWNKSIQYMFNVVQLEQSTDMFKQQLYEEKLQWVTGWVATLPPPVVGVAVVLVLPVTVFYGFRYLPYVLYWRSYPKSKTERQEDEIENNNTIKDEQRKGNSELAPIIASLECIICLEMVKVPFKMCETGHLMCCSCMDVLPECPLCKVNSFWENLVVIKKLLESIPHRCSHSANGCKVVVGQNDKHEAYCPYRSVSCKRGVMTNYCNANVPLCKLVEHYRTNHFVVTSVNNCYIIYNYKGNQHEGEDLVENVPFSMFNHFFWLHIVKGHESIEISFKMHPIGEAGSDYFITLKLNKQDQELSFTLKANVDDAIDNSCSSMSVSLKSLAWFDNGENIIMKYEIYSKPKSD